MKRTVILEDRKRSYDGFFKIDSYIFRRSRPDGKLSDGILNEVFERGDAASVLVRDVTRDMIILVKQFRMPAYLRADKNGSSDENPGWICETMAGMIRLGETPEACAKRELMEELGYRVFTLETIGHFFVSPGGSTERIFLFYAEVSPDDLINPKEVGASNEHEDIERVELSRKDFFKALRAGQIEDAKTIIAAQWLERKIAS